MRVRLFLGSLAVVLPIASSGCKKEDIETEFRKHKKDFDFAKFKEGK